MPVRPPAPSRMPAGPLHARLRPDPDPLDCRQRFGWTEIERSLPHPVRDRGHLRAGRAPIARGSQPMARTRASRRHGCVTVASRRLRDASRVSFRTVSAVLHAQCRVRRSAPAVLTRGVTAAPVPPGAAVLWSRTHPRWRPQTSLMSLDSRVYRST